MSRYNRRIDGNHKLIRDGLRQSGLFVWDTSRLGGGTPDLFVANHERGLWVEIKMPGEHLTPDEEKFFADCPFELRIIATTIEDVLLRFGLV